MKLSRIVTAASLMCSCALIANAFEFQPLGFESIGMGGAGVASARGPMAGYYNPALLTRTTHPFEVNLNAGISLRENNLADNVDQLSKIDFSATIDDIKSQFSVTNTGFTGLSQTSRENILTAQGVLKKMSTGNSLSVMPTGSLGAQVGHFSVGMFVTSDAGASAVLSPDNTELIFKNDDAQQINVQGVGNVGADVYYKYDAATNKYQYDAVLTQDVTIDSTTYHAGDHVDLSTIPGVTLPAAFDSESFNANLANDYTDHSIQAGVEDGKDYLLLQGIALTEVPISYARQFGTRFGTLSIGASAKLMQGYTINRRVDIDTESSDIVDEISDDTETSSAFGVDAGLLFQPSSLKNLYVGVVGKNLNSPSFKTKSATDYTVDPMYRAGINYSIFHNRLDIAADYDLSKNTIATGGESQYLGGGVNYHPSSWFSLRGGLMKNLANSDEGLVTTAGLGFGLKWISLDIAAEMSDKKGAYDGNEVPRYAKVSASLISRW